ncbi:hypothetical protein AAMO2058_000634700 [Amorphochlora amoebiformis]
MGIAQSAEAKAQVELIFKTLDTEGNGAIDAKEALAIAPGAWKEVVEAIAKDGKVNLAELKEALEKSPKSTLEAVALAGQKLRIQGCKEILTPEQLTLAFQLAEAGQLHLFKAWDEKAAKEHKPKDLMEALIACDKKYPGGLVAYIKKAKDLLASSKAGVNPFENYTPEVPHGKVLSFGDPSFLALEEAGLKEMKGAAFVLVAGGLGERLGYSGIKVALPVEITTMTCYLEFYINHILAFQELVNKELKDPVQLPFAIMTSGDTHDKTQKLLDDNKYFGMDKKQLTLVKQDKVPALSDNNASFALDSSDKFKLLTKPHGHGDVHLLLYQSGLATKWAESGVTWISFFQDTNGLVFNALPACLGVSKELDLDVNSLTVPRKPGEAVGAICKLVPTKEAKGKVKELTVNVEYNQLDALLKSTPVGGDAADEKTGFSPYPGNINVLIFKASSYSKILAKSHGVVPEFVNPKYADKEKTLFKKPTRLECMMQDYPRLCDEDKKVGFTSMQRWACFSAVKNKIADAKAKAAKTGFGECGCTGEADAYKVNRKKLEIIGVKISGDGKQVTMKDIPCSQGAKVTYTASFAPSLTDLKARFPNPGAVSISDKSSLVLEGDITIKSLDLDGALQVIASPGAKVTIEESKVQNDGHEFKEIDVSDTSIDEKFRIRGYTLDVKAEAKHVCDKAGTWVIKDGKATLVEEAKTTDEKKPE